MKYNNLRKKMASPLFSIQDLRLLGDKVFSYQLSVWQKQGHIVKLRNGLYAFEEKIPDLVPEEVAGRLYGPSYISLEKALSIYAFIPEMVYAVTSVTPKITRNFNNKIGRFIFRHIKPGFFFGYKSLKNGRHEYLLAEPEKALLDFVYLNLPKIKNKNDLFSFRFNINLIKKTISKQKMKKYLQLFNHAKLKKSILWLLGEK